MTYYGRWTYKYEIASEKGAAAAIIVHETGPAGYPYAVVVGQLGAGELRHRARADGEQARVAVEGWVSLETGKELFAAGGQDFDALKQAAASKDFRPVPLKAKARFTIKNTIREVSRQRPGQARRVRPGRKDEYVVYTAHWDHLGRDPTLRATRSSTARSTTPRGWPPCWRSPQAFTQRPSPPEALDPLPGGDRRGERPARREVLRDASALPARARRWRTSTWTASTSGGRTSDIISIGLGQTTLDDVLVEIARRAGPRRRPDAEPEKGLFYRSDHFEFAKQGVPALDPSGDRRTSASPPTTASRSATSTPRTTTTSPPTR